MAMDLSQNIKSASLSFKKRTVQYKKKRFDEIEKRQLKAIQADDQNPVTIMSLAIVYWRAGKTEESYKLLAELLDRRNFEYIKSGILTRFYMAIG